MQKPTRTSVAAIMRRSRRTKIPQWMALAGILAIVAGCVSERPALLAGQDPANPHTRVQQIRERTGIETYQSRRPVEPSPWREQNERVAPKEKQ